MYRRTVINLSFLLILLLIMSVLPSIALGADKNSRLVLGYYTQYGSSDKNSYNSMAQNHQLIDYIATFDYSVDKLGNLHGQTPRAALDLAGEKGIAPLMLIHNITDSIESDAAYSAVNEPANRANLINNIMILLKKYNYSGVNIDLEGIPPAGREGFNTFLGELSGRLKEGGYLLTLSVPAKTSDNPGDNWSGAYDYATIGELADLVVLMTYDEHWFGGSPGPVASLPWVQRCLDYALTTIPREKIIMGIGAFGYDWPGRGTGKAVPWNRTDGLIKQYGTPGWDNKHSVPCLHYNLKGVAHQVWFENAYSLRIKLDLVNNYDIAGIAFWRLGFDDEAFWSVVKSKFA